MSENKGKIFGLGLAGGLVGASLIFGGMSVLNGSLFGGDSTVVKDAGGNRVSKNVFKNSTNVTEAVKKVQPTVVTVVNLQSPKSSSNDSIWSIFGDDSGESSQEESPNSENANGLQPVSEGSGVIYKKDGSHAYIVTNAHVVDGQKGLEIILENKEHVEGKLVGSDTYSDLAVIQIPAEKVRQIATFGDSSKLTVGEPAIAFGSPLGSEYANSVTEGVVSALDRQVVNRNEKGETINTKAIQTDAAINSGNSGGPLVNIEGQIIGINSSKIAATANGTVEGMGFSIPSNEVVSIINKLETKGKIERPALGISVDQKTNGDLSYLSKQQIEKFLKIPTTVKSGVYLSGVNPATPADAAGLKQYDVITKIDGKEIKNFNELQSQLYMHSVGDTIKVTYYHEKDEKTVDVKLTLSDSALKKSAKQ